MDSSFAKNKTLTCLEHLCSYNRMCQDYDFHTLGSFVHDHETVCLKKCSKGGQNKTEITQGSIFGKHGGNKIIKKSLL